MVGRLCSAVNRFIDGIRTNMFLFPQPVKWVVKQLHVMLTESRKLDARQVSAIYFCILKFLYFYVLSGEHHVHGSDFRILHLPCDS